MTDKCCVDPEGFEVQLVCVASLALTTTRPIDSRVRSRICDLLCALRVQARSRRQRGYALLKSQHCRTHLIVTFPRAIGSAASTRFKVLEEPVLSTVCTVY